MADLEEIKAVVYATVDSFNLRMPKSQHLKKTSDTTLFGRPGKLDSIGLVNFIVATEEALEDEFGVVVSLADEKAMSRKRSPFLTLGTFVEYIETVINDE